MKKIFTIISLMSMPALVFSQSVTSAYSISQQDLRGTARYVSMGGAFGALGGDLTAITQNPGGIGIYRSNDIGFSLGLDMNGSKTESAGASSTDDMTRFGLNNVGAVFTLKMYNDVVPNLNLGFVYNKNASFNRRFKGYVPTLGTSMSNYIAGLCNAYGLNEADVSYGSGYDPYNPPANSRTVPWLAVMGYYGFLTTPEGNPDNPRWYGQFGDGTKGSGYFTVNESGSINDFNIVLGGNVNNKVYVGMNFDITSLDYRISSMWGEALQNAYVSNPNKNYAVGQYDASWALYDNYRLSGTGFKFNMGVIIKPVQELRLGFAFHTPTFYNLNETFYDAHLDYNYPFKTEYTSEWANDGYSASNSVNFSTPWRIIASAAGVIGNNLIISADYEWAGYKTMRYSDADIYNYYDPWYDWDNPWNDWGWGGYWAQSKSDSRSGEPHQIYQTPNEYANSVIKQVYKNTSTIRLGAEFRVLSNLSIRAGYVHSASPVTTKAKNTQVEVPGTGVMTNYTLDDDTNYITCGLGFKAGGFYADIAYVYKHQTAEYYPYSADTYDALNATKSKLTINNNSLTLSLGYKF